MQHFPSSYCVCSCVIVFVRAHCTRTYAGLDSQVTQNLYGTFPLRPLHPFLPTHSTQICASQFQDFHLLVSALARRNSQSRRASSGPTRTQSLASRIWTWTGPARSTFRSYASTSKKWCISRVHSHVCSQRQLCALLCEDCDEEVIGGIRME